jgi:hypothetical protein
MGKITKVSQKVEGIELLSSINIKTKIIHFCENLCKTDTKKKEDKIILLSILPFMFTSTSIIRLLSLLLVIPAFLIFIRGLYDQN